MHTTIHEYDYETTSSCTGKQFFIWIGTKPRLTVMDPVLVKEILSRPDEFQKPRNDHMAHVMVGGLFTSEGNIWSKHKKIINPTFHMDKIKVPHSLYIYITYACLIAIHTLMHVLLLMLTKLE